MTKRVVLSALCFTGAVALAACGSDTSGGGTQPSTSLAQSSAPVTSASVTSEPESSAAPSTSASSSAAPIGTPMTVNKVIKDQVLGHTITVLKYVDNAYQPTATDLASYPDLADQKIVVVQIKATAGSKYYGGVMNSDFRLVKAGEGGYDAFPASNVNAAVAKAGYPAFEDINSGKSGTGWIVFTPPKTYTKLVFGYKRLKTNLPGGKTVAEQVYPVALN